MNKLAWYVFFLLPHWCHNPNLGLVTKAKACKGVGQEWARESHFMLPRVQESGREWTSTLLNELPLWELDSQWIPKSSKSDCRGQNPLDWNVPYIIENLLKLRCLKSACMTHLDTFNTSYGQKKGWESIWQFDFQPLKVKNRPNFLACRWCVIYRWKTFNKGYNFSLDLISIEGMHTKLCAPKVVRLPTFRISRLPLGSLETKMSFGCWSCGQAHSII
jgi:hypothetical protein